jgi:hypothetical protein
MKKMVGTILAVVTLVALVPATASAVRQSLPPSSAGSGLKTGGGRGTGVSNASHRPAPPVSNSNSKSKRLPPTGFRLK